MEIIKAARSWCFADNGDLVSHLFKGVKGSLVRTVGAHVPVGLRTSRREGNWHTSLT